MFPSSFLWASALKHFSMSPMALSLLCTAETHKIFVYILWEKLDLFFACCGRDISFICYTSFITITRSSLSFQTDFLIRHQFSFTSRQRQLEGDFRYLILQGVSLRITKQDVAATTMGFFVKWDFWWKWLCCIQYEELTCLHGLMTPVDNDPRLSTALVKKWKRK